MRDGNSGETLLFVLCLIVLGFAACGGFAMVGAQ